MSVTEQTKQTVKFWLESKEMCEAAGYDGTVEWRKDWLEQVEPVLLCYFKDEMELRDFAMKQKEMKND